jgi:hypothetical protein
MFKSNLTVLKIISLETTVCDNRRRNLAEIRALMPGHPMGLASFLFLRGTWIRLLGSERSWKEFSLNVGPQMSESGRDGWKQKLLL